MSISKKDLSLLRRICFIRH